MLSEWDGNSDPPPVSALRGLCVETFFALRKVFFAEGLTGFTQPVTCGLWWVSWETEQSSGPSGQFMQGIILHFDDQVHSCTEEGISVSVETVQNFKVPFLAAAKFGWKVEFLGTAAQIHFCF